MHSFHTWHQGFVPRKAVLHTAGSGQLPLVPLEMEAALPLSYSSGQRGFSEADYSGGDIIQVCILTEGYYSVLLGVLLCQKMSNSVWKCLFFSFLEGQVSFHLPAAGRLSTQIYLGMGKHACTFGLFQGLLCGCCFVFKKNSVVTADS